MTDTITPELDDETALELAAVRARRTLNDAAGLIAYARSLAIPSLGTMSDGMPRAASKEAPLPFRADAIDDTDDVYARLVQWVTNWADVLQVKPPATVVVVWKRGDDEQGFRAEATPAGAGQLVQILVTWLLIRWDEILTHRGGRAFIDDIDDMFRPLFGKYPRAPRRERQVLPRPCPVCDHYAFGAEWASDDVEDFSLQCDHCGHEEPGSEHLASEKKARKLMVMLRLERQSWDREGVLTFYDQHGYWPTAAPEDQDQPGRCRDTATLTVGTFQCEREDEHAGLHIVRPPGEKPYRWGRRVPATATA